MFAHCVVNHLNANRSSQATLLLIQRKNHVNVQCVANTLNMGQTFVITGDCMLRMDFLPATYVVNHLAVSPI